MSAPSLAVPSQSAVAASIPHSQSGSHTSTANYSRNVPSTQSGDHGSNRTNSSHYNRRTGGPPSSAKHDSSFISGTEYKIIDGPGGRILCLSDIRGNLELFNTLAMENRAQAIIHTGDFGFYEVGSFDRISDRTLRHLVQYSTLIPSSLKTRLLSADANAPRPGPPVSGFQAGPPPAASCKEMRSQMLAHPNSPLLTQFPLLLTGALKFRVPVYTAWGACEDVRVLEKVRTGEYYIENLHVLDEATTSAIEVGGLRLRLFGLGGALVLHKLFDNGEGAATIAGGQGTMWTTMLQIGELVDTAQKCYDPSETRILITHASPGREGLLTQLALALKVDLTISAGLHFRYGISYNEFSVQSDTELFRRKLLQSKASFGEIWDSVRSQVEDEVDDQQRVLLNNALAVTNRVPSATTATGAVNEDPAWKNTWNWNLPDAAYGHIILDIRDGTISTEMKSIGFSFANRRSSVQASTTNVVTLSNAASNRPPPSPIATAVASASSPARSAAPIAAAAPAPPTGPSGGMPAVIGASNTNKGPLKSPRTQNRSRPPLPSQPHPQQYQTQQQQPSQGNNFTTDSHHSTRPASSKGPRNGEVNEDRKDTSEVAPANGSTTGMTAKEISPASTIVQETGITPSASNHSIKSNKSKSNRKKSASGWSSKSEAEKSADEKEFKASVAASQDAKTEGGELEKREGGGQGRGRGGRGGRGGGGERGRGGRGGGRGAFSRGGGGGGHASSGERRKPSASGADGAPKEQATTKPPPTPTTATKVTT